MFFFICWGKKRNIEHLGYAADFCPVCRKITPFAVKSAEIAKHLYFVPVGEGEFLGYIQTCQHCRSNFSSDINRFHRLVDTTMGSVDSLAQVTYPTIFQKHAARLALETRIAADPHSLDGELRIRVMMESFKLASSFFNNNSSESGIMLLGTMLRPLDPSEDEVRRCLGHFRRVRARIGRIRTADVIKNMKSVSFAKAVKEDIY